MAAYEMSNVALHHMVKMQRLARFCNTDYLDTNTKYSAVTL